MKKFVIIWSLLLIVAKMVYAQGESPRTVTVVGAASTQIMADNIAWYLTVTVKDDHQKELRTQANEILSQVMAAADRLGIDRDSIEYDKAMIRMRYKNKGHRESDQFSHHELSQRLTLFQNDVEQYDEYWRELTAIEGVLVSQGFFTTQLEPTRRRIRVDALHAAKEKAEDYAAVIDGSIGKALSISEIKPDPTQSDLEYASALRSSGMRGRPEKIEVSARVYVVFELE